MMSQWWVWGDREKVEYGDKEKMRESTAMADLGVIQGYTGKRRQLTARALHDGRAG